MDDPVPGGDRWGDRGRTTSRHPWPDPPREGDHHAQALLDPRLGRRRGRRRPGGGDRLRVRRDGRVLLEGGVVDKALIESREATFTGDLGFAVHAIVGGLVLPVAGLALGVVSLFVKGVPRARTLAWATFALIFVQGSLGYAISDTPYVGLVHGANALLVLVLAIHTARSGARATERVTADAPATSVHA